MGTVIHHTIVVTSYKREALKLLRKKACHLFEGLPIPKVTKEVTNGYCFLYIPADGSKEGWGTSNHYDDLRQEFFNILNYEYDSGNICEWYEVRSGETEQFDVSNSSLTFAGTSLEKDNNEGEYSETTVLLPASDNNDNKSVAGAQHPADQVVTTFDEANGFQLRFDPNNGTLEVLCWCSCDDNQNYVELKTLHKQATTRYSHTIETLYCLRDRDRLISSMATYMCKTLSIAIEKTKSTLIWREISSGAAVIICSAMYDHYTRKLLTQKYKVDRDG